MKTFFFMSFFCLLLFCSGQKSNDTLREIRIYSNFSQILSNQLNLGIEKTVGNVVYGFDVSYYNPFSIVFGLSERKLRGNAIDINIKKRITILDAHIGLGGRLGYVSYEPTAYLRYASYRREDEYFKAHISGEELLKRYQVTKKIWEVNLKICFREESNTLAFDYFLGLGLRGKDVSHVYPRSVDELVRYRAFTELRDQSGKYLVPVIKLGILIAFRVKYPLRKG